MLWAGKDFVDLVQSGVGTPIRAVTNHFISWPMADAWVDQYLIRICWPTESPKLERRYTRSGSCCGPSPGTGEGTLTLGEKMPTSEWRSGRMICFGEQWRDCIVWQLSRPNQAFSLLGRGQSLLPGTVRFLLGMKGQIILTFNIN